MKSTSTLRFFLAVTSSSILAISSSHANQIWDGGDVDDANWNSADNWGANTLPTFTSAITFTGNTRNAAVNDLVGATIGGINFTNDGSVGKTNAFTLSGNQITLSGDITTTAITTGPTITDVISHDMIMSGGRTATTGLGHDLTISGVISGTTFFQKKGAGTLTLSNLNSFTGNFLVTEGTVNANTIKSSGEASSVGASGNIIFNSTNGESVVNYTGGAYTAATKFLVLGNGAGVNGGANEGLVGRLNNNGSGALVFSAGNLNGVYSNVATGTARTLVLGGSNTDANTVGVIRDNTSAIAGGNVSINFRKEDAGTWVFRSANTYTGTTTVNGGLLTLNTAAGSINTSSSITINGGKLLLENATNNKADRIANNVTLGGGELSLSGNAAGTSESFGTLGIAGGDSTVTVKGVTAASTLAGSAFSRTGNGTALLRGTSLGQASSLGRITLTSTAGLSFVGATTLNNAANTNTAKDVRIVPYLVGGTTDTDVASTFVTYDTTLGFRALNTTNHFNTTLTSATNVRLTANTTAASSVAINSLIIANTSATALTINDGQTLTVSSGAILFTNTATIKPSSSTGILAFGSAEGVVTVNSGLTGTLSANISGSNGLTKGGTGTLSLAGANTYTGVTTINAGTLSVGTINDGGLAGNLGQAAADATNIVFNGGTLKYTGANATSNRAFTISAGKTATIETTNDISFAGATGAATNGALTKTGAGKLTLTGSNTYTGATTVSAGTLSISSTGSTHASSAVTVSNSGSALIVNGTVGGSLLMNANTTLSGTGTITGNAIISGTHNPGNSPGNSPGIQTFSANLAYVDGGTPNPVINWELNNNTVTNAANPSAIFDQIIVSGNLDFTDLTTLNLIFNETASAVLWLDSLWSTNQSWTLFDVAGTTTNFDNLELTTFDWLDSGSNSFNSSRPGSSFSLSMNGQDVLINYTAVPETSTALLSGLGALALLRRRRK